MKNGFLPAYHRQDKWISILFDGSVSMEEIFPLIDKKLQSDYAKAKTLKNWT